MSERSHSGAGAGEHNEPYAGAAKVAEPGSVMGRIGRRTFHLGHAAPGRHRAAQFNDVHFGSQHCDASALIKFCGIAVEREVGCFLVPGDVLDGMSEKLIMEQRAIGFEKQVEEAVEVMVAAKIGNTPVIAIAGNHDRYFHDIAGVDAGAALAERMRAAGVNWHYIGSCLGRAVIFGARVELYHPHGGGPSRAAVRRTLAAKVKTYLPEDRPNILLGGHFHKFSAELVHYEGEAMGEGTLVVGGGTFQRRDGDFGIRMIHPWDIGGGIVSWSILRDGRCVEPSVEFVRVQAEARGWAA